MRMVNGSGDHMQMPGTPQSPQPLGPDTPVAYYQPIAITPSGIKWLCGAVLAVLVAMPSGVMDRYLSPAKDSELKALQVIVQTVQQQQTEFQRQMEGTRDALSRLTLAVDNLSGIVDGLKKVPRQAVGAVKVR